MNRVHVLHGALALLLALPGAVSADEPAVWAVRAGKILTMAGGELDDGVMLVEGKKIKLVGRWGEVAIPDGVPVVHFEDAWLTPGLIELHCHVGAGEGFGDLNDSVHQTNPELRNLDTILPSNEMMRRGLEGGVTTALFIPGSGSNMSGFGTLVKFAGKTPDECVVRFPGALKIAQAGNPERPADMGRGRMGMNSMIRATLLEGKAYHEAMVAFEQGKRGMEPPREPRLELLRGLFTRQYPLLVHTAFMQVQHSTVRILHDELGLDPIISHGCFDAFLNSPFVAERPSLHVNLGPRQVQYDRRARAMYGLAERWWAGGVRNFSVCTDSPVLLQEELFYQGTLAAHFGAPSRPFLEGTTIGAAKALYIADRLGSLEPGKDADCVVWGGDPFDPRSRVLRVWIDGKAAYDQKRDRGRF